MDQDEIEKRSKVSTVSAIRAGEAERRTTSRTDDTISGRGFQRLRRLEQRQQLEAQLRAAEGKLLGDQDVGRFGAQQAHQRLRARGAEGLVERRAVEADQLAQAFVAGAQRRQLMKARGAQIERRRRAARHQQHVEAARRQGARQRGGAAQMADAEQVLDIEEDARAHATRRPDRLDQGAR